MSLERTPTGVPPEPNPPSQPAGVDAQGGMTPALRLQILSTEHYSLLSTRSLAWNESFSRAGMFLSTLSGVIVALALVGQGSGFGQPFVVFAIVLLPIALLIGITTLVRMGASNYNDALAVVGMNRIRAAYLEMDPDLARFFVTSAHDDIEGIDQTMASPPGGSRLLQFVAGSPTVVAILDAVIVGALATLLGVQAGFGSLLLIVVAVVSFALAIVAQGWYSSRSIGRAMAEFRPMFPRPVGTSVRVDAPASGD